VSRGRSARAPGEDDGVIVFAGLDWWYHNRAHSDFQLARMLAAHRPVLLVNSIGARLPVPGRTASVGGRIGRKLRSIARGVRRPVRELPNFHVYSPFVIPAYGSPTGRALATALVRLQVGLVRRLLGIRRPAVIVTPPTAWPVVRHLPRSALIFNRSDKHSAFPEADASTLVRYEDALLRSADTVLYVSRVLQAEDAPVVGGRAVFLDHGVDSALFDPSTPVAPEIDAVPRPRIGYFGSLRDHVVDPALLLRLAREVPDASLVLVGPSTMDLAPLLALPNVHPFGPQPHERVPAFGVGFDVAVMPWLDNEWIHNCNPIKLKEYLALGLPVVTTAFPEAEGWPVRTVRCSEEFIAAVREYLADPGDSVARRAAVTRESWAARGDTLRELLDGRTATAVPDQTDGRPC
jgi:glycosyltransferase involved in cell wall biosynthesis